MRSIVCLLAVTGFPGLLVGQNIATGHANFTAAIASWSQEASNAWQYGWTDYSQSFGPYFQVGLRYPAFVSVSVFSVSVCLCLSLCLSLSLSVSVCKTKDPPTPPCLLDSVSRLHFSVSVPLFSFLSVYLSVHGTICSPSLCKCS